MAERDFKRLMQAQQSSDGIKPQLTRNISSGENTIKMATAENEFQQLLQSAGDMSKVLYQPGDTMEQDIL